MIGIDSAVIQTQTGTKKTGWNKDQKMTWSKAEVNKKSQQDKDRQNKAQKNKDQENKAQQNEKAQQREV